MPPVKPLNNRPTMKTQLSTLLSIPFLLSLFQILVIVLPKRWLGLLKRKWVQQSGLWTTPLFSSPLLLKIFLFNTSYHLLLLKKKKKKTQLSPTTKYNTTTFLQIFKSIGNKIIWVCAHSPCE